VGGNQGRSKLRRSELLEKGGREREARVFKVRAKI